MNKKKGVFIMMVYKRNCSWCGKEFETEEVENFFCSDICFCMDEQCYMDTTEEDFIRLYKEEKR